MRIAILAASMLLAAPAYADHHASQAVDESEITLGNGEHNAITLEGATRAGSTFTFPSLMIERNGWLVMHPFRDGAPVRTEYVGATYVSEGSHENVAISVSNDPQDGTMYIVMLHFDMNDDQVFDFGDGITVPDAPALEGTRLIAMPFAAPPES